MTQLWLALVAGSAVAISLALLLVGPDPQALGFSLSGYLIGALLSAKLLSRGYPHALLGLGNLTTLFRMALVASLLAPVIGGEMAWPVVIIATIALVLDGVDGWFARREGRVSSFGARLDMEVDSAISVVLALNVFAAGVVGPWVLLLASPRYLFVAAARFFPWLSAPLKESLARKVICVVQVAGLIALNAPILPGWLFLPVAAGVAGALIWSFGRDIIWLWKTK